MTRLIDADALSEKLCETTIFIKGGEIFQRMINDAPTIESDGDLISRQDAVKEIDSFCDEVWTESEADFARGLGTALSIVESLPSAEQVTGKLNNPDDSLLTADSEACKEQKSKLDLISRQAAIRWVKTECNPYGKPTLDFESGKKVIEHLGQMPSADRPHGEWEKRETVGSVDFAYCSECKQPIIHGHTSPLWNFCPNCGADMRGEEE